LYWLYEIKIWFQEVIRQITVFVINPAQGWSEVRISEEKEIIRETAILIVPSAFARLLGWGYWGFGKALGNALVWYVLLLGILCGIGLAIRFFGQFFQVEMDSRQSLMLSRYTFLPFLAGSVLYINPMLGQLVPAFLLVGLYWFYHGIDMLFVVSDRPRIILTVIMGLLVWLCVWILGSLTGGLTFHPN
jgi:hypothetical protein